MLSDVQIAQLMKGQALAFPVPARDGEGERWATMLPIRSKYTGRVVRFLIYYVNPRREPEGVPISRGEPA